MWYKTLQNTYFWQKGNKELFILIMEPLRGMEVRPIKRDERSHWDELIRQHHYMGLHSLIGETIRYIEQAHKHKSSI